MTAFWKAAALVLVTVILGTALEKREKDMAVVLTAAACCMVGITALVYLKDVMDLVRQLGSRVDGGIPYLQTLLQIAGISILTELVCDLSADAGAAALGKAMHILGNAAILYLTVPVIEDFVSFLQEILSIL